MTHTRDLLTLAINYHKGLPVRIRQYLNDRGIPDVLIDIHLLGWNGRRITIPIYNREGEIASFKLARDPNDKPSAPKMTASPGAHVELYSWVAVLKQPSQVIICEGEFDKLVLEANGFLAVTSTGGAGTFRQEWVKEFEQIPNVYICYDNDEAGRSGAARVSRMIPHARVVNLPDNVGKGGDVTDFFVRLGRDRKDFTKLLEETPPAPPLPETEPLAHKPASSFADSRQRVERLKRAVPIASIVESYVKLQQQGATLIGLCPFHEDRNPSFTVYPATGTYHCFGCRRHGDSISFLREIEHLDFGQALDALDRFVSQHGHQ